MINEARPPVSELSAVEYEDISFKGTLATSFSKPFSLLIPIIMARRP